MVGPLHIKDQQKEQRIFLLRSLVAAVVIGAMLLVLIGRLVLLQVVRHDEYLLRAEGNRARIEPLPANRGLILDRNGKVLAENQPSYQLELVREQVPDLERTLAGLTAIGVLSAEEIDDVRRDVRARRGFEAVPIRRQLSEEQMMAFAVHRHQFPGVDIRTRSTRSYPHGALAVHALGYVGTISESDLARIDEVAYRGTMVIGKRGVEAAREAELHGVNGFQEILVNAQGRSVADGSLQTTLRSRPPVAGSDLILSLDLDTQQAAEAAFAGRRGAAVALDPNNGDVLAFVSMPGFDPSLFGRGISAREYRALEGNLIERPLFNRAIMGTYPAGSTVKPVLGMAGLAYGLITADETHYCPGQFRVPGSSRLAREGRGGIHGAVALRDSISRSCDVYYYALALELGVDRIHEFLSPFGFGKRTGIDIAGEVSGILPSRDWKRQQYAGRDSSYGAWYPGDTVNIGIGQGYMTVTPMQLAQVTAVLAAQGNVFQPRLVTGIVNPTSGETTVIEPKPLERVQGGTPEQWKVIMEGMRDTMIKGTARAIATSAEYNMAGKTGTAQVFSVPQGQSVSAAVANELLRDHSWFIAFAPAENPQIAVAVLVENGGFGASAAAPIARQMFDAYLLPRLGAAAAAATAAVVHDDHEDHDGHDHEPHL